MTVDPEEMHVPCMDLAMNDIPISGNLPSSPPFQREMLKFAALRQVLPLIETFAFTEVGISQAIEKLWEGVMIYRAVVSRE